MAYFKTITSTSRLEKEAGLSFEAVFSQPQLPPASSWDRRHLLACRTIIGRQSRLLPHFGPDCIGIEELRRLPVLAALLQGPPQTSKLGGLSEQQLLAQYDVETAYIWSALAGLTRHALISHGLLGDVPKGPKGSDHRASEVGTPEAKRQRRDA
jgi:hypothetical protein